MTKPWKEMTEFERLQLLIVGIITHEEAYTREMYPAECDFNPQAWRARAAATILYALKDKGKITWEGAEE